METTTEIGEARDWQGNLLDCGSCEHCSWQLEDRCRLGHACVHDRYARRIDRFFRWHPALGVDYFTHPYFEVHAIAAKYADLFHLPQLVLDPDETVRRSIAERLPAGSKYLKALKDDLHREVRIRVAQRLDVAELASMACDEDYLVRQYVARRLPVGALVKMIHDPDTEVRKVVARRIGPEWIMLMTQDRDVGVRIEAVRRATTEQLKRFLGDPDWQVRYEVAKRVDDSELVVLADDPDPLVRELAQLRLGGRDWASALPEAC